MNPFYTKLLKGNTFLKQKKITRNKKNMKTQNTTNHKH